jgi:cytochrome P450
LPREVVGLDGVSIDGYLIPEGTIVGVSPYVIHRNAMYFQGPLDFTPERWLEQNGRLRYSMLGFTAFSGGSTGCIGQHLAMMEMSLAVARLLWRFDLRLSDTNEIQGSAEFKMRDRFVGQTEGPLVRLLPCSLGQDAFK